MVVQILEVINISDIILSWYNINGRKLPWRMNGKHTNPYHVLVSEFMLQQTKVNTVIPYFYKFINKFKSLNQLASATRDDILLIWQGLGYYSRAIRLQECAKIIINLYNGIIPSDYSELIKLPGIGDYTASSL